MEAWKIDPNKRALAIVRRSSTGQKDNTSAETQEREIRDYAARYDLELLPIEPIIETAFKSKKRAKYHALMNRAQKENVRHILFFVSSREARNLGDLEHNEDLIRSGKIVIHHVSEGKVYWSGTPDSDFTTRGVMAVLNKGESQANATKIKAAYKTKALNGWWPYNHTPLGYIHKKDRDKLGNAIKGTAIVVPDPDTANIKLVQREFELRAQGHSYDVIRQSNIEGGLVPLEKIKTYHRSSIEKRLKNSFYWGTFQLNGDSEIFKGKHEPIIPAKDLKAVKAINEGHGAKVRKSNSNGEDLFRGWLTCAHPDCQRAMTYDPKTKTLKGTGEEVVYHYYRCSNSRKIHQNNISVSESKIWDQFEPAVEALTITEDFAKDIAAALNETHVKQNAAIRKQMEGFRLDLRNLEGREDRAYEDFVAGVLNKDTYQRQITRVRDERKHFENEIERLTLLISDEAMISVQKVFELAINAKSLYKSMDRENRLLYLKKVCSNPTLDGLTLHYQLEKPFKRLSSWKENSDWRRMRDSNSRYSFGVNSLSKRAPSATRPTLRTRE